MYQIVINAMYLMLSQGLEWLSQRPGPSMFPRNLLGVFWIVLNSRLCTCSSRMSTAALSFVSSLNDATRNKGNIRVVAHPKSRLSV